MLPGVGSGASSEELHTAWPLEHVLPTGEQAAAAASGSSDPSRRAVSADSSSDGDVDSTSQLARSTDDEPANGQIVTQANTAMTVYPRNPDGSYVVVPPPPRAVKPLPLDQDRHPRSLQTLSTSHGNCFNSVENNKK